VWLAMLVSAVRQLLLVRVRTVQWGVLMGQLVWWVPWVLVAMKGFLGLDAYEMFGYRFVFGEFGLWVVDDSVSGLGGATVWGGDGRVASNAGGGGGAGVFGDD